MKVITIDSEQNEKLHTIDAVSAEGLNFKLVNEGVEIRVSYSAENKFPVLSMKESAHETSVNQNVQVVSLVSVETGAGVVSVATNFNAAKTVFESFMSNELQKSANPVESVAQSMKRVQFLQKCKKFESVEDKQTVRAIQKAACNANNTQGWHDCHSLVKAANFDKKKERALLDMLTSIEKEKDSRKKSIKLRSFLDKV